jgi:short-subunit dehydrogenase
MSIKASDIKPTVLITGASTGIGAVYADRFARRGHNLVLVARDFQRLENLAARLWGQYGVNVAVEVADLANRSELERIEQLIASDPHIGILVNNAGMAVSKPLIGSAPDDFQKLIDLNITAAARLGIAAANAFVGRGGGSIINLSSVVGLAPEMGSAVYGGSKAFILNFSRALHVEAGGLGLRVQAVLPGATRTEIWERSGRDIQTLDPAILMDVHDMVDAALVGFDAGEQVTIPSLPEVADWQAFDAARQKLLPNLSRAKPAARYRFLGQAA